MTTPKQPVNRVVVHLGAAKQAIRLLKWLATNEGDDPEVREVVMQSRECARDLLRDVRHPKAFTFVRQLRKP